MGAVTTILGGSSGPWCVTSMVAVTGAGLPPVEAIAVAEAPPAEPTPPGGWRLYGIGSNHRYATRAELTVLGARQQGLGRAEAACAALIPIRKSAAWWGLAQDERLTLFRAGTGHNEIGLDYLPAVARRLLHCRDLGEPFDFLTWFEFAPSQAAAFDGMLRRLRATEEWSFVEREVEIRLERLPGSEGCAS
jgi:hypothetical protein